MSTSTEIRSNDANRRLVLHQTLIWGSKYRLRFGELYFNILQRNTPGEKAMDQTTRPAWDGDALDRAPTGDFLYELATQKYLAYHSKPGSGALCFALDADWGAGKTFFVERWSRDVETKGHPVIHFDAWVNDLSDDPLLGFMASLRMELAPLVKKLPVAGRVKEQATKKLKDVVKTAGRAVLPVSAVLGKALLKKIAALDAADLGEALEGITTIGETEAKELTDVALDKFFEEALKSHSLKQDAIKDLKKSIEELLQYLADKDEVKLPLYFYVDELDRCRPDYAIKLLEGVKHLFNAQGICFVFSTNLSQLSASARAVYGQGFDAERYLKRFFSFQFLLPEPDHLAYSKMLIKDSIFGSKNFSLVVTAYHPDDTSTSLDRISRDFALVARMFDLDLRSQKQVFQQSEAVAAVLKEGRPLYAMYLFFLVATLHRSVKTFDELTTVNRTTDVLKKMELRDVVIAYTRYNDGGNAENAQVKATEMFTRFHSATQLPLIHFAEDRMSNYRDFPESVLAEVRREAGNSRARNATSEVASYWKLVRTAGQLA